MNAARKENRKLWIIFLICLLIALLPWIVLANDFNKSKGKQFNCENQARCKVSGAQKI